MVDASETFSFLARPIEARLWQVAKGHFGGFGACRT
jgi:hypothetical protein